MNTYRPLKRGIDIAVSSLLLTVSAPVMAVVAALVKRHDGGEILYRARRVGRHGGDFTMLKFRTMVVDAETRGGSSTAISDARITPIGHRLRRHKLDELPQLFNVLRGDMSLVGPRPQVAWDVARYTTDERRLLDVAPGITDWASIKFRDEGEILAREVDPDEAYDRLIRPEKIRLGLEYVDKVSLATDLSILVRTLGAMFRRDAEQLPYSRITEGWDTAADDQQWELAQQRYSLAAHLAVGKDIVEAGCGTGYGLAKLHELSASAVGIDPDQSNVDAARQRAPQCDFRVGKAENLPLADNSVDLVLGLEMIYYLPDRIPFLQEARRVLRPGGQLLLTFPNHNRRGFQPSPFSTSYPDFESLQREIWSVSLRPELYGSLPLKEVTGRSEAFRRLAVRAHLIPTTLAGRARIKRLLRRRMKPLRTINPDASYSFRQLDPVHGVGDAARFAILVLVAHDDVDELERKETA